MTSFHFKDIKLEHECELDLQFCDSVPNFESMLTFISLPVLNPIHEPTLITIPIDLEHEPPILDSHIPLLGKECKSQFFGLDSTLELKLTIEPKLYLSHIP